MKPKIVKTASGWACDIPISPQAKYNFADTYRKFFIGGFEDIQERLNTGIGLGRLGSR
jgi:hypothetical protein